MVKNLDYTTIALVLESWEALKRTPNYEEKAGGILFQTLCERSPPSKALFGFSVDIEPKSKLFLDSQRFQMHSAFMLKMLDTALGMLGPDLELLTESLRELGKKHDRYGVQPEMFDEFGKALQITLFNVLGKDFDEAKREAWKETYQAMSNDMIKAYQPKSRQDDARDTSQSTKTAAVIPSTTMSRDSSPTLKGRSMISGQNEKDKVPVLDGKVMTSRRQEHGRFPTHEEKTPSPASSGKNVVSVATEQQTPKHITPVVPGRESASHGKASSMASFPGRHEDSSKPMTQFQTHDASRDCTANLVDKKPESSQENILQAKKDMEQAQQDMLLARQVMLQAQKDYTQARQTIVQANKELSQTTNDDDTKKATSTKVEPGATAGRGRNPRQVDATLASHGSTRSESYTSSTSSTRDGHQVGLASTKPVKETTGNAPHGRFTSATAVSQVGTVPPMNAQKPEGQAFQNRACGAVAGVAPPVHKTTSGGDKFDDRALTSSEIASQHTVSAVPEANRGPRTTRNVDVDDGMQAQALSSKEIESQSTVSARPRTHQVVGTQTATQASYDKVDTRALSSYQIASQPTVRTTFRTDGPANGNATTSRPAPASTGVATTPRTATPKTSNCRAPSSESERPSASPTSRIVASQETTRRLFEARPSATQNLGSSTSGALKTNPGHQQPTSTARNSPSSSSKTRFDRGTTDRTPSSASAAARTTKKAPASVKVDHQSRIGGHKVESSSSPTTALPSSSSASRGMIHTSRRHG